MRESKIERELVERVKQAGGMAYKLVTRGITACRIGWCFSGSVSDLCGAENRKRCTEPNAKETDQETGGFGQDVDVICGIDELSQFFQDAGFTEISKAIDCKYDL